jgi:hypothetical protein
MISTTSLRARHNKLEPLTISRKRKGKERDSTGHRHREREKHTHTHTGSRTRAECRNSSQAPRLGEAAAIVV